MLKSLVNSFLPHLLLVFFGLVFNAHFLPVLGPVPTGASEGIPISTACNGSNNRGLLIVHKFPNQDACLRCKNDPTDCGAKLVGQPSDTNVCPGGNNYLGTTTNPYDGLPTVCSDTGDCGGSCSSSFPNCAVAQLDCLNGLGGGINAGNLQFNCDCPSAPPPKHKACQNDACVLVDGAGADSCGSDADCAPATHKECRNNACAVVSGAGNNSCNGDSDCVVVTHKECRNNACTVVSGSGSNQCNVDGDCVPSTHKECRNNSCVTVSGSGSSSCNSDSQCQPNVQRSVCDNLSVSPTSGDRPLTVTANLSGHTENGGSIANYRFTFGDGTSDVNQSGQTVTHTYNNAGTFLMNGYVKDDRGNEMGGSGSCQKTVIVTSRVLGVATPPVIPSTGAETGILLTLVGSGGLGWFLTRVRRG
ncbi:PKD domain-containing protein [Candidatus Microgenomates bacterium]|nr:PKD domain-containing protein [Candidatus Microgenomates bacterium]